MKRRGELDHQPPDPNKSTTVPTARTSRVASIGPLDTRFDGIDSAKNRRAVPDTGEPSGQREEDPGERRHTLAPNGTRRKERMLNPKTAAERQENGENREKDTPFPQNAQPQPNQTKTKTKTHRTSSLLYCNGARTVGIITRSLRVPRCHPSKSKRKKTTHHDTIRTDSREGERRKRERQKTQSAATAKRNSIAPTPTPTTAPTPTPRTVNAARASPSRYVNDGRPCLFGRTVYAARRCFLASLRFPRIPRHEERENSERTYYWDRIDESIPRDETIDIDAIASCIRPSKHHTQYSI
eukprot:scaffold88400_cov57-Attheya_sp.AAC.2